MLYGAIKVIKKKEADINSGHECLHDLTICVSFIPSPQVIVRIKIPNNHKWLP